MKRRTFIQRLAATGIVLPFAMGFPRVRAFAQSPAGSQFMKLSSATNDHVLVMIRLAGGNDGLNTIVPYADSTYYTARKGGLTDDLSIAANTVLKLPDSNTLGLHPSLAALLPLYNEKKMAIVQNVGYPGQNLSHFRSTDIWLSGSDSAVYENSGWYAKYLEELHPDYPTVLPTDPFAIELGTYLSTTLIGEHQNMGVAISDLSYVPGKPDPDPVASTHAGDEEAYVREIARQSNIFSNAIIAAAGRQLTNKVTFPTTALAQGLAAISRLIAAGMGTQMYILNVGGYDTHSNQLAGQATLHLQLAEAVAAFQRDLEAFGTDSRVSTMTISEFGRRVASNGTGTDHGSAAPLFVFGSGVKGGLFGHDPNLTDLEGPGNLKMQYDFRQIYASTLSQWFGAADDEQIPALPRMFEQLPIFKTTTIGVDRTASALNGLHVGQNYPNPTSNGTSIPVEGIVSGMDARLTVYGIDGRELMSQPVAAGQNVVTVDTGKLPSGTYLYELKAGEKRESKRMTVTH
jgi:uncharacterized protein (DUF1501 family)